jgi:hypothetical protein
VNTTYPDFKLPVYKEIYTVREIILLEDVYILLDEIDNSNFGVPFSTASKWNLTEIPFNANNFREVQPPMQIEINELISSTYE